jgi:peptidoglycan/LPS O-acetylase OafA/YrhL
MDAIALGYLTALLVSRVRFSRFTLRILAGFGLAILAFSLGFSTEAYSLGLARNRLNMTILAVSTCMITASAAQTQWTAPWVLRPVVRLGQRSYEIYLTHMFVVFGLFELFVVIGKPRAAVPALFVGVILVSGLSGEMVAGFYSEPLNRWLRRRWGDGANRLGSAVSRSVIHEKNSSTTHPHSALE